MANPFLHIELQTNDVTEAKKFYTSLFDWSFEELSVPDGEPYPVIKTGEAPNGGIFGIPSGGRPYWLTYIKVDDIQATAQQAKKLGAKVLEEISEFGEYGWMCVLADPAGAVFAIWQYKTEQH
ncbi:MAG: VOC family protein [Methylophilaceae bacterium]